MTGISWRKWQGEWAAYGPADIVRANTTITVTKRSGQSSQERIAEVRPARPVDGVKMAYGLVGAPVISEADAAAMTAAGCEVDDRCRGGCQSEQQHLTHRASLPREQQNCMVAFACTGRCDDEAQHTAYAAAPKAAPRPARRSGMCDGCGQRRGFIEAVDMSGIPGMVCRQCKRDEGFGLSFM